MARREVIGTVLTVDQPAEKRGWGWTPAGVEVGADHLVIGDRAVQVREVASWPSAVASGSVSDVGLVGESALVLALAPVPAEQVNAALDRALPRQQSAAREAQKRGTVDMETQRRIQDALALKEAIASGQVRHFDCRVSSIYWSDNADAARTAGGIAQRRARERGMDLVSLRHSQAPSYHGALAGGKPVLRGLLLDQQQASSLWPFTDEDLLDPNGLCLGINERTGAPVLWDPRLPDVGHACITGDTGFGKTVTLKVIASQDCLFGRPALLLDPSAKNEYRGFAEALGGVYLPLRPSGGDHINPLEVLPDGQAIRQGHTPEHADGRPISERVVAVKPIIAALLGEDLEHGPADAVLEAALQTAYRVAGLADSWGGCFRSATDALGGMAWAPTALWPVLSDVRKALSESPDPEGPRYARMLDPYCAGGSSDLLDGQTTVRPNAPVVGIGVNEVISAGGRFSRAGYATVIDFAARYFRSRPEPFKTIAVDEAHNLLADPVMARWLERQLREARRAGVTVLVISQGVGDFLHAPAGRAIWQNSRAKVYMHQPAGDLGEAATQIGLDPATLAEAAHLPIGHAILQVGDRTLAVAVQAPVALEPLLRSDVAFTAAQGKEG